MARPKRAKSAHKTRRTLADEDAAGKVNMVGTPDPDRYYHVVVDRGNKVQRLQARGYRIEEGGDVTLGDANPKNVGGVAEALANPSIGERAVLMSIEREFKNEDDAYRQKQVDETEKALHRSHENEAGRYGKIKEE